MATLTPQQLLIQHEQKIQVARRRFEIEDGGTIDPNHVQEWALLDIAEKLGTIRDELVKSNAPPGPPLTVGGGVFP